MKKPVLIIVVLLCMAAISRAQTVAEQVAGKIAQKMKDSLSLMEQQRVQLYNINILLSNQKSALRQQYTNADSLRYYMQRVENTRDSLYRPVLGEEKYQLYRQKKRNLVNNN